MGVVLGLSLFLALIVIVLTSLVSRVSSPPNDPITHLTLSRHALLARWSALRAEGCLIPDL